MQGDPLRSFAAEAKELKLTDSELDSCDVWILGGGVSCLTTEIVLQSLGVSPCILTETDVGLLTAWQNPLIPTGYAMASAYPHNLQVANLNRISADSQEIFDELAKLNHAGVRLYQMFEVYEHEPAPAALGSQRKNFQLFDGKPDVLKSSLNPPCRPGAEYLWGWSFHTHFADMPPYLNYLWTRFQAKGGKLRRGKLSLETLLSQGRRKALVNCLGFGAIAAFGDVAPANIMRGKQVLVPGAPLITNDNGMPVAYNYTPPASVFARGDGLPEYVHYFPRKDGWLLGQTREPGFIDEQGNWVGEAVDSPETVIDGLPIPAPIIDLNAALLQNWLGVDFSREQLVARSGYRYYRDPNNHGVRLHSELIDGSPLVHNYGHGGSGVTMSWGCSLECARLLSNLIRFESQAGDGLDNTINRVFCQTNTTSGPVQLNSSRTRQESCRTL